MGRILESRSLLILRYFGHWSTLPRMNDYFIYYACVLCQSCRPFRRPIKLVKFCNNQLNAIDHAKSKEEFLYLDQNKPLLNKPLSSFFSQDCRGATSKICQHVLGKADYQLGRTKVFLKDAQDLFLEQERDRVLTKKIQVGTNFSTRLQEYAVKCEE